MCCNCWELAEKKRELEALKRKEYYRCPKCHSDNTDIGPGDYRYSNIGYCDSKCRDCGHRWLLMDLY